MFDKNVNNILHSTAIIKSLSCIATVFFLTIMLVFSEHITIDSHFLLYLFLGVYSLCILLLFPSEVCHNKSNCSKFLKNKYCSDLLLPFWRQPTDCVGISHCCMVKAFLCYLDVLFLQPPLIWSISAVNSVRSWYSRTEKYFCRNLVLIYHGWPSQDGTAMLAVAFAFFQIQSILINL